MYIVPVPLPGTVCRSLFEHEKTTFISLFRLKFLVNFLLLDPYRWIRIQTHLIWIRRIRGSVLRYTFAQLQLVKMLLSALPRNLSIFKVKILKNIGTVCLLLPFTGRYLLPLASLLSEA